MMRLFLLAALMLLAAPAYAQQKAVNAIPPSFNDWSACVNEQVGKNIKGDTKRMSPRVMRSSFRKCSEYEQAFSKDIPFGQKEGMMRAMRNEITSEVNNSYSPMLDHNLDYNR